MSIPQQSREHARPSSGAAAGSTDLRIMLILSTLMSFASMSTDMYLPALPTIGRMLHASAASIDLTFSASEPGSCCGDRSGTDTAGAPRSPPVLSCS
jgi:hypothetical protein